MKMLSDFFYRHASWRMLGLAFVAYALFPALLLPRAEQAIYRAAGKEVGIIDLGFGLDLAKIRQQVADYGEAGRAYYRRTEMTLDVLYPLAYSTFFALVLSMLLRSRPAGHQWRRANVLPFVIVGFDFLENICIIALLSSYPEQNSSLTLFCAIFRLVKWLLFALMGGLILFLIGQRLFRRSKTG